MALSGKRKLFVEYYLKNGMNGAKAARQAGYAANSARQTAYDLLRETAVRSALAKRYKEVEMESSEVLYRLKEMASVTVEDFFDFGIDERLIALLEEELAQAEQLAKDKEAELDIRQAAKEQCRKLRRSLHEANQPSYRLNLDKAEESGKLFLIKGLAWTQDGRPKLELHDAKAALELIGKRHKLFAERLAVENADESPFKVYVSVNVENV